MELNDQRTIFERWVADYQALLYKVVRIYAQPSDTDDLLQDILMQLWLSIPSFKQQSKPSTWIYRVALNTALAKQRKDRKHNRRQQCLDLDTMSLNNPSYASTHEPGIINQLYDAIRQLAKIDRSLILMHLDGLNHGEIAEIMGITENHVNVKLHRAKKQIEKLMKGVVNGL